MTHTVIKNPSVKMYDCPHCEGEGELNHICSSCSGSGEGMCCGSTCNDCRGLGEHVEECEHCEGTGYVDYIYYIEYLENRIYELENK